MGLDTTHDCWHGPYSAFGQWREVVCAAAGLGRIRDYIGFGGEKKWPTGDVITELLNHSDCDGEIAWHVCAPLADRLEVLMPEIQKSDRLSVFPYYADSTDRFIRGLRRAHEARENVEFR